MNMRVGVVMDPIGSIYVEKDSTYAMLLEAQSRRWKINYMEQNDLYLSDGQAFAYVRELRLFPGHDSWFALGERERVSLSSMDVILMRKDPPFDMEYIYTTYLLEQAEFDGALVVNPPAALRDANEKLFSAWVPECTPPTLVTRSHSDLRTFLDQHEDVILKPLHGMGGESVFRLTQKDPNISVVMETLTEHENRFIMAQRYIPEVTVGDKRVLMVDGIPVEYALARIPAPGETRGNLAAGATGKGVPLSERDRWICDQVRPLLRDRGILFAGLDIIGDFLTEINVTSPTCIRELDAIYDLNIAGLLCDVIEAKLSKQ